MTCPIEGCPVAPVRPDALVTCYHVARSVLLAPASIDPSAQVEVRYRGKTLRIGAEDSLGQMLIAVRRHLSHIDPSSFPAVAERLLLLFDLVRTEEERIGPWVRLVEGRAVVHDSLLRAAAVAEIAPSSQAVFDPDVLADTARRFDADWGVRYPTVSLLRHTWIAAA